MLHQPITRLTSDHLAIAQGSATVFQGEFWKFLSVCFCVIPSVVFESTPSESKTKTESWATKSKTESSAFKSWVLSIWVQVSSISFFFFFLVTILLFKHDKDYKFSEIFYFYNKGHVCQSWDGLVPIPWVIKAQDRVPKLRHWHLSPRPRPSKVSLETGLKTKTETSNTGDSSSCTIQL